MANSPKITLYDLRSRVERPYSPFTWQVRMALNYKKLPFKTVWLHMPDVKPAMQELGTTPVNLSPTEPNGVYLVPVIKDETIPGETKIVQESFDIIAYLDKAYPDRPALFPEGTKALFDVFDTYIREKIMVAIFPIVIMPMLEYLDERDRAYFREKREQWLGKKLEDVCSTPEQRQECLIKAREGFDAVAKTFDRNGEGSHFVMGDKVSKADLVLIGTIAWIGELDKDAFEQIMTWSDGRWARLWAASEEWRENKA